MLKKFNIKYSLIFHALQDNLKNIRKIKNFQNKNATFFRGELNVYDYLIAYLRYLKVFFKVISLNKNKIFYNSKLNLDFYSLFEKQYKKSFYGIKCPETILNIICTKKLVEKFRAAQDFYVAEINHGKNFYK